jgi:hypothetical protein
MATGRFGHARPGPAYRPARVCGARARREGPGTRQCLAASDVRPMMGGGGVAIMDHAGVRADVASTADARPARAALTHAQREGCGRASGSSGCSMLSPGALGGSRRSRARAPEAASQPAPPAIVLGASCGWTRERSGRRARADAKVVPSRGGRRAVCGESSLRGRRPPGGKARRPPEGAWARRSRLATTRAVHAVTARAAGRPPRAAGGSERKVAEQRPGDSRSRRKAR